MPGRENNMIEVEINIEAIKAAGAAASTEASRYYLNGVCIELSKRHGGLAVATNGHILMAIRCVDEDGFTGEDTQIIIPSDTIKLLKPIKGIAKGYLRQRSEAPSASGYGGLGTWEISYGKQVFGFTPVDGTFPNWRDVLPKHTTIETPSNFNIAYLETMRKAFNMMSDHRGHLSIIPNGASPAWITASGIDGFGIIMPMRGNDSIDPPAWTGLKPHQPASAPDLRIAA
jgi:hypothetical protein